MVLPKSSPFRTFLAQYWPALVVVAGYLLLGWTNPFSTHHYLFNLEPYPDGLFYVVPALKFFSKLSFDLSYQGSTVIHPTVLPAYTLFLAVFYGFWSQPSLFYWANLALGIITVLSLMKVLSRWQLPKLIQLSGGLLMIAHLSFVWLVSVPMAENLGLAIFMSALALLPERWSKVTPRRLGSLALLIGCLALTKYTFICPAMVLALFVLWNLRTKLTKLNLLALLAGWMSTGALFIWFHLQSGFNPFNIVHALEASTPVVGSTTFYSFQFIWPNLVAYSRIFLGAPTQLLWLNWPVTTILVTLLAVYGIWQTFQHQSSYRTEVLLCLCLFLAQWPLQLVFYVVDARYLILSLPLLAVFGAVGLQQLHRWQRQLAVLGVVLLSMVIAQRPLARQLVASNWLNRSEGWQYQAIQTLNQAIQPNEHVYVVSFLPPFLASAYAGDHQYQLLPASPDQEFINKGSQVWGTDIDYQNIPGHVTSLLRQGQTVYISNAYLTAQKEFPLAYQTFQNRFSFTLVQQGCLDTCNVYRLSIKPDAAVNR